MFTEIEPVLQNSFCKHDSTQSTPLRSDSPIVSPQGAVCTIAGCDGETTVVKKMDSCSQVPFGFLMQEIQVDYNHLYVPHGYIMERDKGTQRCFVGDPIGVAHLGLYRTNVYDNDTPINAGDLLYATASGTLCKSTGDGYCQSGWNHDNPVAVAMNTLSAARVAEGRYLNIKLLI